MPSILSWHRFIVDQIIGVFFHYFFGWRGYIYIRKLASICERNYRMIKDSIAESLEARGLYRRAASRWVDVMQTCVDDNDREWIRMHRNKCLKKRSCRRRVKKSLLTSTRLPERRSTVWELLSRMAKCSAFPLKRKRRGASVFSDILLNQIKPIVW